jgi:AAA domain
MTIDNDQLAAITSTNPNPPDTPLRLPEGVWAAELEAAAREKMAWLWHGYLAPGSVTLLTSRWKAGKTTLLSVLLARRVTGGVLADRPLTAGRTAVVSEESRQQWHLRRGRLDFGNHTWFLCCPFPARPLPAQWLALIDRLAELRRRDGVDLVVIDSLARFLPGRTENHAALMLEALAPLQRLTERDMAVLLLHHPKKGGAAEGQAARGSGALSSFADVLIEMDCRTARAGDDRRRVLRGFSRYDETPRELVIELNAAGTDYAALGDARQDEFQASWSRLEAALMGATGKLTRREIAARWLGEAVRRGLVRCEGAGSRESPLRYWLPQTEEAWKANPLYELFEADRRAREELRRLPPCVLPR